VRRVLVAEVGFSAARGLFDIAENSIEPAEAHLQDAGGTAARNGWLVVVGGEAAVAQSVADDDAVGWIHFWLGGEFDFAESLGNADAQDGRLAVGGLGERPDELAREFVPEASRRCCRRRGAGA